MDLRAYMRAYDMLSPGDTVLCAVSGGRDSMCLLHYLYELSRDGSFQVAVVHLNHMMRDTAQRDIDIVEGFCQERGIPCYIGAVPVYEMAKTWNLSVEEAGRRARYELMERVADQIGAARIATAHHQNDQAETVLLNLLRGTGPEGLGGIPPVRGRFIRPLLQTSRAQIEAYVAEHHIAYGDDETNTDTYYARNRLRLELLPELCKLHEGAMANICRAAQITREESGYLDTLAAQALGEGTSVACDTVRNAPEVLQLRMMRLLVDRLPIGKKDFTAAHYRALARLAEKKASLTLPYGARAYSDGNTLTLTLARTPEPVRLCTGTSRFGSYLITTKLYQNGAKKVENALYLAAKPEDITVQVLRGSERLHIAGQKGPRTVKRLMQDKKIPAERRATLPGLFVDGQLVAVCHIGTSAQGCAFTEITYQYMQEDTYHG